MLTPLFVAVLLGGGMPESGGCETQFLFPVQPARSCSSERAARRATCSFTTTEVFEQGFAWRTGAVSPPYDGAFGEAFDIGSGTVSCVTPFWRMAPFSEKATERSTSWVRQ